MQLIYSFLKAIKTANNLIYSSEEIFNISISLTGEKCDALLYLENKAKNISSFKSRTTFVSFECNERN